jgi:hypothetical protein
MKRKMGTNLLLVTVKDHDEIRFAAATDGLVQWPGLAAQANRAVSVLAIWLTRCCAAASEGGGVWCYSRGIDLWAYLHRATDSWGGVERLGLGLADWHKPPAVLAIAIRHQDP